MFKIKEDMIVYHLVLLKREKLENNPTFKVLELNGEHCKVEIVELGYEPFDKKGKTWDKIPVKNLIPCEDYEGGFYEEPENRI